MILTTAPSVQRITFFYDHAADTVSSSVCGAVSGILEMLPAYSNPKFKCWNFLNAWIWNVNMFYIYMVKIPFHGLHLLLRRFLGYYYYCYGMRSENTFRRLRGHYRKCPHLIIIYDSIFIFLSWQLKWLLTTPSISEYKGKKPAWHNTWGPVMRLTRHESTRHFNKV